MRAGKSHLINGLLSRDQIAQLTETGRLEIGDAQLVWRGKDQQDWSELVVQAPPLYIQEKIHPKAIIEDLKRQTKDRRETDAEMPDLFANFNGGGPEAKTEFYQHDQNWQNRMILGDSLQVMASLAEREGLCGQVQCIYFDPPYGIKFNSNWQVSTRSRDVKDGKRDQITREPEQVKAFRDTWKDGIHSYLTYLRDRLTAMRDLLTESGSIFVQIGDENVHRVRALMDEVFGEGNFVNTIAFKKKSATYITETVFDEIVWYCRNREKLKIRNLFEKRVDPEGESKFNTIILPDFSFRNISKASDGTIDKLLESGGRWARVNYPIVSQHPSDTRSGNYQYRGRSKKCGANKQWRFSIEHGLPRLEKTGRLFDGGGESLGGVVFWDDWNQVAQSNIWTDMHGEKYPIYVVQTTISAVQRCILMASDPGDLVLDPTCGSGTTAYVAEQWGRRWITIDTSRVSLALARARLMSSRYSYYVLADSEEGSLKEAELTGKPPSDVLTRGDLRQGFVYERAPRITLKSIANNAEIDVIWEAYQGKLEPLRERLNAAIGEAWKEWEIPREADTAWPDTARQAHADWWKQRIARQKEIDASIAKKADVELLYDRPYENTSNVRVSGPFTVESLSPHRVVPAGEVELIEQLAATKGKRGREDVPFNDFTQMVLENLKSAGVHQAAKDDRITLSALEGWPGNYIAAEGHFMEGETEWRAAIFIGPEFGTVTRADLTAAAREALDARFDALIACGFNFDAHTSELTKLGPLPILKAKMNPDLHMSEELKNTGAGNLFIVFGEPDVEWKFNDEGKIIVEVLGVDVFDPKTGEVRASRQRRHRRLVHRHRLYRGKLLRPPRLFYGRERSVQVAQNQPEGRDRQRSLGKRSIATFSQPFPRPSTGRFAVKIINHFGDEVMKVFGV